MRGTAMRGLWACSSANRSAFDASVAESELDTAVYGDVLVAPGLVDLRGVGTADAVEDCLDGLLDLRPEEPQGAADRGQLPTRAAPGG